MKKIILPDVTFTLMGEDNKPQSFTAAQQLLIIVSVPPQGQTMTVPQMRAMLSLVEKLEKAKGRTLLLEDEEHKLLLPAVNAVGWGGFSRQAIALADAVENAEEVKVKEDHA